MNKLPALLICIPSLLLLFSGCADVQPWERGNLAKPVMASDPTPMQSAIRQHDFASREAAGAAASGATGGGCGCN